MKLLVTGGCGFIGSHFVREVLSTRRGWRVLNVDLLTYAGRGRNLADLSRHPRYRFARADIAGDGVARLLARERPDAVVNFAAESHVDRSIHGAAPFLRTNALGAQNLLDAARAARVDRFAAELPAGLDTRIGEGGYGLSGGQAQRVAIARAFLKNAPVLLLDEPTAHLDPATESEVLDSLRRLALGRTVILASHAAAAHAFSGRRVDIRAGRVEAERGAA